MAEDTSRTRYCANCLTTFLGNPETCANTKCARARPGTHWGKLLEPGERIDGRFRIDRRLRIAGAGPSYLCQETDDRDQAVGALMVIQVISPEATLDQDYFERLQRDVALLHGLEHPNVVRLQRMQPPTSGPPFVAVHYEQGGTLLDQLREQGAMPLKQVAQVGLQICGALQKAHEAGLAHGDLNPDRVILEQIPDGESTPALRVTDFGALKTQGNMSGGHDPDAFSPQYAAPERIDGAPPSVEADIYAVGGLLLFTLTLQPLIAAAERMDPRDLHLTLTQNLPPRWTPPPSLGVDATQVAFFNAVLNATMSVNPDDRCELREIQEYLEAILEVQDEEIFAVPEEVSNPQKDEADQEEPESAEETAHFSAFAEPDEQTSSDTPKTSAKTEKGTPETSLEESEEQEEAPAEPEEARPPRDWLKMAHRTGIGLSAATIVLWLTSLWIQFSLPHWLPPQWLEARAPAAADLQPGDPTTQPDYDALIASLNAKKARLQKCELSQETLSVYVVVQPNGRVSAAGTSYLPLDQRRCVRKKLLSMVLKRRSRAKSLRLRTTLVF